MTNAYEPDDWETYYDYCPTCGRKYHRSGAESCACEQCLKCKQMFPPDEMYNEDLCLRCVVCEYCGRLDENTEYVKAKNSRLCTKCREEGCE